MGSVECEQRIGPRRHGVVVVVGEVGPGRDEAFVDEDASKLFEKDVRDGVGVARVERRGVYVRVHKLLKEGGGKEAEKVEGSSVDGPGEIRSR